MQTVTHDQLTKTNGNGHGNGKEPTKAPIEERVRVLSAPVDVYEHADALLVFADLPGVRQDHLELELDKGELKLVARRIIEGAAPIEYRRSFQIPREIDLEGIEAKLEGGVLTLRLPRSAAAKPKQIPVKTA